MKELDRVRELAREEFTAKSYRELIELMQELEMRGKIHPQTKEQTEKELVSMLRVIPMDDMSFIFFVSILWNMFLKVEYLELLLECVTESTILTVGHLEFLHYQVICSLFRHPEYRSEKADVLLKQIYDRILRELKETVKVRVRRREERDLQKVVVVTPVILGENHAPTHSMLERSYMLEKLFGVNVCLVSAKEGIFGEGIFPYYRVTSANCIAEYFTKTRYQYKDRQFGFYQGKRNLDSLEGMQELVDYVCRMNPYYILYIGGQSYVADLLNEICPVVTVSTVFSSVPDCNTAFAMVGRKVSREERKKSKSEIIEVPFSFEIKEKKRNYTREELGIPQEEFVMAVVGNRLDYDVKDAFLERIQKLERGFLLFIGSFETYQQKTGKYPWLKEHSRSLGRVEDVLGVLECADLYVNPRRLGGGFSVIEAFHAGIPAVSINYGDVAVAAGEEFCVADYDEMLEMIHRYQSNADFYQEKCAQAKARELEMTNGEAVFREGIEKVLASPRFY